MNGLRNDGGDTAGRGTRMGEVSAVDIVLEPGLPAFAMARRGEIEAHWQARLAANPALFNGPVLGFERVSVAGGRLSAVARRMDFATLLALLDWRPAGVDLFNLFGAAAIFSSDGRLLLGRMSGWTANPGHVKFVGGTPDDSDVTADGRVDLVGSIARECAEETGLDVADAVGAPSFLVVADGPLVGLVGVLRFPWNAAELVRRIEGFIAADPNAEIEAVVVLSRVSDAAGLDIPCYNRVALEALLPP